jgi:membrane protease YdiL (CAAX protease family)
VTSSVIGHRANDPVIAFFLLVAALSVPLWVLGAVVGGELMPGLPVAALQFLCPVIAASILRYRQQGAAGVTALLGRSFDRRRITDPRWYVPILFLVPAVFALAYGLMVALGRPLPAEPDVPVLTAPVLLVVFFFGGLTEELGWMGYAVGPMQARWGALRASLLLGAFWAAWHWVPLLQGDEALTWIAWWSVGTLALRVLHVWIYDNTGDSVFGQALFHATFNVAWQLFPNHGSHFDPAFTTPILVVVALLAVAWWRPGRSPGVPHVPVKVWLHKVGPRAYGRTRVP